LFGVTGLINITDMCRALHKSGVTGVSGTRKTMARSG
jgi:hypothetical protein